MSWFWNKKKLVISSNTAHGKKCKANWQVQRHGATYTTKCRSCGVLVTDGGTPKCLNEDD